MKTILVVEDEFQIANPVKEYLEKVGYRAIWSSTGYEALDDIKIHNVDLVLLDLMMPDLDGYGFLERLRRSSDIPVIIISAKTRPQDKVRGFDLGADDYVTKPFSLTELRSRIEYHLRKSSKNNLADKENRKKEIFEGGLEFDKENGEFLINDQDPNLTIKEKEILELLIKNKGNILSKNDIYETVWKEESLDGNNTVTVHIKSLREKLKEDLKKPKFIETVWGKGYKFIGKNHED